MANYYLDEKFMEYRQADFLAQARHETLVRELKQASKSWSETNNRVTANRMIFNWFAGPKKRSFQG